jgi:hypothetical protein
MSLEPEQKQSGLQGETRKDEMYDASGPLAKATRSKISEHIGIQKDDIIAMFVKPGGNMLVLRHFLAVDKDKRAIVLAIRGTFSVSGILIDIQAAGGTLLTGGRFGRASGDRCFIDETSCVRLHK